MEIYLENYFVGPADSLDSEQINVASSTRAVSDFEERARYELGRNCSFNLTNVPICICFSINFKFSSSDPSHKWTAHG